MNIKSQSILLVDEHPQRKTSLSSRLRMQGFTIDVATGGFHAIHLAEKNNYNLVMLIDDMEDMPAQEALSMIRMNHDSATLPVLVMRSSGNELDQSDEEYLREEQVNEICPWQDEFKTVLRNIQRHLT